MMDHYCNTKTFNRRKTSFDARFLSDCHSRRNKYTQTLKHLKLQTSKTSLFYSHPWLRDQVLVLFWTLSQPLFTSSIISKVCGTHFLFSTTSPDLSPETLYLLVISPSVSHLLSLDAKHCTHTFTYLHTYLTTFWGLHLDGTSSLFYRFMLKIFLSALSLSLWTPVISTQHLCYSLSLFLLLIYCIHWYALPLYNR